VALLNAQDEVRLATLIEELQHYAREPISLDQTIGEEGDSAFGDFIEDSQAVVAGGVPGAV
jgi:RNA polymerase primary sigma factor